jgi:antitoxin component YwqK of YwqJK toxin-antitoxin module
MQSIFYCLCLIGTLSFLSCKNANVIEEVNDVYVDRYTVDKEGQRHGEFRRFFGKDTLAELSNYDHGQLEGTRTLYFDQGSPEIVETYVSDTLHGPYTVYFENGEVQISGAYDHGELRGTWKRYYPGGGLLEEVTYEDNLENGPFKEYYKNGNLKARGKYLDGDFEHDTLFMYTEAGTLARLMLCNRGICNTIWIADSTKEEHRISEE